MPQKKTQLSRDNLIDGTIQKLTIDRDGKNSSVLSLKQLKQSRKAFLGDNHKGQDIWVFGYGSLIWNPLFEYEERRLAQLYGYHRRFCLWTHIGRGSPTCPGLVLGLDRGGSTKGFAYRIRAEIAHQELDCLWRREMVNNSYLPKWLNIHTNSGVIKAISFTVRHDSKGFAPKMSDEKISRIIEKAKGFVGPCKDYLFDTNAALKAEGIRDKHLDKLAQLVSNINR